MRAGAGQLLESYAEALGAYLAGAEEAAMLGAYELGRSALEAGMGTVDVAMIHGHAVSEALLGTPSEAERARVVRGAAELLAESLAPFEMALRGFRETNEALQHLTETLEQQVAARTVELRESLEALRRADHERGRLLTRLVNAQEEERRRIAGDIHDDSIQVMVTSLIRLDLLARRMEDPELVEMATQLRDSVQLAIARLRHLLFELWPVQLEREGLVATLGSYLQQQEEVQPSFTWRLEGPLNAEPPSALGVVIYRIAQEALVNVRKHARASRVEVVLRDQEGGVLVQVRDDGTGFEPDDPTSAVGHIGLTAMRERAELVGGWCTVGSAPEEGTTVEFWVPTAARVKRGDVA